MRRLRLVLAVAALVAAAGAGGAHAGTRQICVGDVVDFGHLGGGTEATCARVPDGTSGSDILIAAGHKVTFDPRYGDDFVCTIDGRPAGGCSSVDDTHSWVYFHRAPGSSSWHASSEGSGTYQPVDHSTEGWAYDDGQNPPPQPPDVSYSASCPPTPTPTPIAKPTAQPRTTAPSAATPVAPSRSTHAHVAPVSPTATATPTGTTRTHDRFRGKPLRDPRPASSPAPTLTGTPAVAEPASAADGTGGEAGVVAAVGLCAVLGAGATWQLRRRRRP
jgi:hypothetical protein